MSANLNPTLFRLGLPEWLKKQVGNHKGVFWIDEKEKILQIPWKHGSRNGWEDGDVSLFKAWAIHTKRYREGIDKPKPASWKSTFRCAINNHNHIFFVKDQEERRGEQAHRIMKIVDPKKVLIMENCKPNPQETRTYAEPVRKRVRVCIETYPSCSDETRKPMVITTKSNAKVKICDDCCGNNYWGGCAKCRVMVNNDDKHMQHNEKFSAENGANRDVLSTGFDISTMKTNLKHLTTDRTSDLINPIENRKRKEGMDVNKFVARSPQISVIVSINNDYVSTRSLHSHDVSVRSDDGVRSDDDDDELIMPRESPSIPFRTREVEVPCRMQESANLTNRFTMSAIM